MAQQDPSPLSSHGNDGNLKRTVNICLAAIFVIGISIAFYRAMKEIFPQGQISKPSPREWVSLKEESTPGVDADDGVTRVQRIRIAIAPIVSPEKSMEMYGPFADYVGKKLGRKPTALYRQTYSEINDLVRYRQCDFAIVCTYPFIRGAQEFGMQALVIPQIHGEIAYQAVILVPRASPAKTLLDLRGKRFASADIISTTGWLFPAMRLMDAGENPYRFFGEHLITRSHDRSLQAVFDGFVDGAAVHGLVYSQIAADDPSIRQKLRILEKSAPFGIPPIAVHPDLDPELRKELLSVLLSMHKNAEGKSILEKLQMDQFMAPGADLFASLRLAISKLEKRR